MKDVTDSNDLPQSGVPGVSWHMTAKRWRVNHKSRHGGLFVELEDAIARKAELEAEDPTVPPAERSRGNGGRPRARLELNDDVLANIASFLAEEGGADPDVCAALAEITGRAMAGSVETERKRVRAAWAEVVEAAPDVAAEDRQRLVEAFHAGCPADQRSMDKADAAEARALHEELAALRAELAEAEAENGRLACELSETQAHGPVCAPEAVDPPVRDSLTGGFWIRARQQVENAEALAEALGDPGLVEEATAMRDRLP